MEKELLVKTMHPEIVVNGILKIYKVEVRNWSISRKDGKFKSH